jgi:hypothetical protein
MTHSLTSPVVPTRVSGDTEWTGAVPAAAGITWHTPSAFRWVAYRDATRVGSIDFLGAYIATNQYGDVIGAYVELADAQVAVADPQPADADLTRRTHVHQTRRDARLRHAALAVLAVLFVLVVSSGIALMAMTR